MCELQENQFKRKEEKCKTGLGTERNWNLGGGGVILEYYVNGTPEKKIPIASTLPLLHLAIIIITTYV